jgi:hypothetical protein
MKTKLSVPLSVVVAACATLASLAATPIEGKVVSVKKYAETHTREEFLDMIDAKRGGKRANAKKGANPSRNLSERKGRSLAAGAYCEDSIHCEQWNTHYGIDYTTNQYGWYNDQWCETEWDKPREASDGTIYYPGTCVKYCDPWNGESNQCEPGTYCSTASWQCTPCSHFVEYNSEIEGECTTCNSHSDCSSTSNPPTYCATNQFYDRESDNMYTKVCSSCIDCYDWNAIDGSCPSHCAIPTNTPTFKNSNYMLDREQAALTSIPAECWRDAAAQEYEEMYVGDCGSFGEETDLWCEGFCLADSWLDCCDPKAGAIAALTMGCFFAFVGTLFSISWVLKCWCFKKPNALMLQAMQQQQHARMMAANQMQHPVVVQMQAASPAQKQ